MTFDDEGPQVFQASADTGKLRDQFCARAREAAPPVYDAIYDACEQELSHPRVLPATSPMLVRRVMIMISDGRQTFSPTHPHGSHRRWRSGAAW